MLGNLMRPRRNLSKLNLNLIIKQTQIQRPNFMRNYTTSKANKETGNEKSDIEPPAAEDEISTLKEMISKKTQEIQELKDLYRMSLADCENLRNRTKKELQEKSIYAIQSFAKELLTTCDTLDLALKSIPHKDGITGAGSSSANSGSSNDTKHEDTQHLENLWTGVSLTKKSLLKTLNQFGIVSYDPMGQPFDFNKHTAIFQATNESMKPGTVFHVERVGYMINDRVLRSANVGVVKEKE